jgi:aminopeptidase N
MSKKVKRLFEGFQPHNYRIELDPNLQTQQVTGRVVITGQKTGRPSQRITLHQHGLKVTQATIVKTDKKGQESIAVARISHHKSLDELRLHSEHLLYPGTYTITLDYVAKVQETMHGIYASTYDIDGQKQKIVSTQFESHHAREAFPCVDEPEAKATFDLTLTSPTGQAVIGNTPIKDQQERDGKLVTTFETSPKMSTYLLAFVFGDLQYKETKTDGGVDVRVWATKAHPAEALDFGLEVAKRGIEFFDEYYGVPYPLTKCDHVAIPDFSSGAMENWGLITYRERCLLVDPATTSQSTRELVAGVICHELSHQWFGNLVTMRWWDDLWLNESFANVMEHLAPNALYPEWKYWNIFIAGDGLAAIRRDSIAGVQPIKTEVHHPDEISTLFDPSIVYAKGGRLIKMLIDYIGEEAFRKGLKAYFTKHAYGNTTGDDLWAALGEASGKDVASFMNPWLERPGFPVVKVDQQEKQVHLQQTHFLQDTTKADLDRIWPVPLLSSSDELPELFDAADAVTQTASTEFVRVNEGAIGHYVVQYMNPAHMETIAGLASQKALGEAERLMLLSDSSMLARAGYDSFTATLQLLQHYSEETSEPVWDIMALVIADARRFIDADESLEASIKALIRDLIDKEYQRLGWDIIPGEPSQDTKLRGTIISLGAYSEHPAILSRALELFEAYKHDQQAVHSELRSIVFGAAIRNDVPGAFEYLLELDENTNNVDLKQEILGTVTLVKDQERAALLLERIKDSNKVRLQDVDHWLVCLLRNRSIREQAWQWLQDNWGWLEQTFAEDKSYDYLPRYAASAFSTQKLLDEYTAFFGPKQDQPALARNIAMGIEEIKNRVTWLDRDVAAVRGYFSARQ